MPSTQIDRVDGLSTSMAVKVTCKTRTTINVPLYGLSPSGLDPSVTLTGDINERVLVMSQVDKSQNGIYQPSVTGWRRVPDFDGPRDVRNGTLVESMTDTEFTNAMLWRVVCEEPVIFGTTEFDFVPALLSDDSIAGQLQAGTDTFFQQLGTGATPRSFLSKLRERITPQDFGAKADGFNDDRAAILLADAEAAARGKTLFFPCGTYAHSAGLTATTSWRGEKGTLLQYTGTAYIEGINALNVDGIVFSDFEYDGNCSADPVSWNSGNYDSFTGGSGLQLVNCDRYRIINVHVRNVVRHGFRPIECRGGLTFCCTATRMRGNFGDGFLFISCVDYDVIGCRAEDYTRIGFVFDTFGSDPLTSYLIRLTSCHAENGHDASRYYGGGEYNAGFWGENVGSFTATNCTAKSPGTRGVNLCSGVKNNGFSGDVAIFAVENLQVYDVGATGIQEAIGLIVYPLAGFPVVATANNVQVNGAFEGITFQPRYDGDSMVCSTCHVGLSFDSTFRHSRAYAWGVPASATFTKRPVFSISNSTIQYLNEIAGQMEGYGTTTNCADVGCFTGDASRLGIDLHVDNVRNTDEAKPVWIGIPINQSTNVDLQNSYIAAALSEFLATATISVSKCKVGPTRLGNGSALSCVLSNCEFVGFSRFGGNDVRVYGGEVKMTGTDYLWLSAHSAVNNRPAIRIKGADFTKDIATGAKVLRLGFGTGSYKTLIQACNFYNSGSASASNAFIWHATGQTFSYSGVMKDSTVTNMHQIDSGGGAVATPTGVTAETFH